MEKRKKLPTKKEKNCQVISVDFPNQQMNGTSEESAKSDLANLDLAYLISYAVFMFVSGWVAERLDLRYFLSGGWMSLNTVCPCPCFRD